MRKVTKQIVGIDIGKGSFYACYKILYSDHNIVIKGTKEFSNNLTGYELFLSWCKKRNKTPEVKPVFIMEATGSYYESLAYFLDSEEQILSVQLAKKIKYFAKSCNLKTKNDKVDAKMIAQFGIEKELKQAEYWKRSSPEMLRLKSLVREHRRITQAKISASNQLHAMNHSESTHDYVLEMKKDEIEFFEKQADKVTAEILLATKEDNKFYEKVKKIESIPGVGFQTVITIIAETDGLKMFNNIPQLVSYCGLDIVQNESGSFTGKTRISKQGNTQIRSSLYMPALASIRCNKDMKIFYDRVCQGRQVKKQAVIAVMRKLLILIYTLWKIDEEYIENFEAFRMRKEYLSSGNDAD